MPVRMIDWSLFGSTGVDIASGQTVDTGGVAVTVDFTAQDEGAGARNFDFDQYVAPGENFDPTEALKLMGLGGEGGADDTSTTAINFASAGDEFGDAVTDVSFRINDLDLGQDGLDYQDIVTIRAYDADGNEVPVTLTPGGDILTSGQTATGNDNSLTQTPPTMPETSLLVDIAGPITRIEIDYDNGGSDNQAIWVTDVEFSTTDAGTMPDGYVDGDDGDDLIDIAYTGDPSGDFIDRNDQILPDEGENDDIVRAMGGNDTVLAGDGDDDVFGGDGNDSILGEEGDDILRGEDGDDTIEGGAGNDTIQGGNGNDVISGGDGADDLQGRADADVFLGVGAGDTVDGGTGDTGGGDYDTLDLRGLGPFEIVNESLDADRDSTSGTVNFLDSDGNVTGTLDFIEIENLIPCFTPGTVIATPRGERRAEDLQVGDRIITRDNGLQEIRWVGQRNLSGQELLRSPHLKPVLIRAGSLGQGLPERDLLVSPQHRMLISSERASLYFEEREVLAAAKHLTGLNGVDVVESSSVSYIHFMFDQHEVVLSNGSWTESFQPGEQVLDGMGTEQRDEIYNLFPELREAEGLESYQAARRSLKKHEAKLLVK